MDDMISRQVARREQFGNSEQLDCSDCVNHGGDWDCDHVHYRKGTDTISRQAVLKGLEDLNIASFYELDEHSKEAYTEVKAMLKALPSAQPQRIKGKWIDDGLYSDGFPHHAWHCSECEESVLEIDEPWFKFCPSCGADMRKDGEHETD